MASEWMRALSGFGANVIATSVTKAIAECKWWPTIAEVVSLCAKETGDWREVYGVHERESFRDDVNSQGRTEAEEIAKRIADCKRFREQYNFGSPENTLEDSPKSPRAASDSMEVGFHLRNSCAARRARREETCSDNCSGQNCKLKAA